MTDTRSPVFDPATTCQKCRRVFTDRTDRSVHATLCTADTTPFFACRGALGCRNRVFVGHTCPDDGWLCTGDAPWTTV